MGGQGSKPKGLTRAAQATSDNNQSSLFSWPSRQAAVHVETVQIVSQDADQFVVNCKIWTPTAVVNAPRAAVLFIHGGVFCEGNQDSHTDVTRALVQEAHLAVLTCDFRDGSVATYASHKWLADLKACAVWLHERYHHHHHAHTFVLPMGVVGSSSGGWFAMALANQIDMGCGNDSMIQFCILLCPVAHPQARAVYLQHCQQGTTPLATGKDMYGGLRHAPDKAASMLQKQLRFFESYKQMAFAAERVAHNHHHVPTLLILGAHDQNVPPVVTANVVQNWAWRTVIIGSAGHEVQNIPPPACSYDCYLHDINRFLEAVVLAEQDNDDDDDDDDVHGGARTKRGKNATSFPCWLPWCR